MSLIYLIDIRNHLLNTQVSRYLQYLRTGRTVNDVGFVGFCGLWVWPFYNHFWSIYCQVHWYISQNCGSEGLNNPESQFDQKLWLKLKLFLTTVFFNFWRKRTENVSFKDGTFSTICGWFFWQLNKHLLKKWDSEGYFEVLCLSKS